MVSGVTGESGRIVEHVFIYVATISVALLALITFLMVYFVIRYRRSRHPHPQDIQGSTWLEIVWTLVPTAIVLTMFYYGLTGFTTLKKAPEGAMKVKVTARMWSWTFEYENGIKAEVLKVPVGKPVLLILMSQDVIHSFYIPAFKIKQDAVPGMENHLWFLPTEVGTYEALCAEYCGLRHSYMLAKVEVLSGEDFKKWYEAKGQEAKMAKVAPSGSQLFLERGCKACHSIDGSPLVGPTMKGLFEKDVVVMEGGKERTVVADEAYLRKSILEPNADIVKGFPPVMPPQQFSEEEVKALTGYIRDLK
jgi:cytochrome c oxidase subunit II